MACLPPCFVGGILQRILGLQVSAQIFSTRMCCIACLRPHFGGERIQEHIPRLNFFSHRFQCAQFALLVCFRASHEGRERNQRGINLDWRVQARLLFLASTIRCTCSPPTEHAQHTDCMSCRRRGSTCQSSSPCTYIAWGQTRASHGPARS